MEMSHGGFKQMASLLLLVLIAGAIQSRQAVRAAQPRAAQQAIFLPVVVKKNFDLQVSSVKVIQGTTMSEDYAVYIAHRKTMVRVFIGTGSGRTVRNVAARMCGYDRNGAALGCLPADHAIRAPSVESDLERTANFELPPEWLQPGNAYYVEVDPERLINESNRSNNRFPAQGTESFDFVPSPALNVQVVPVRYQPYPDSVIYRPKTDDLSYLTWLPEKVLPVPTVNYEIHSDYFYRPASSEFNLDNPEGRGWQQLLHELTDVHYMEDPLGTQNYFGVVDSFDAHGCDPSCIVGDSNVQATGGKLTAVGWSGYGEGTPIASRTLVHEMGHNFGRAHVACTGFEPKPDPDYPYPGGSIGVWGLDVAGGVLYSPEDYGDFMSYCTAFWTSDYTYWHIDAYRKSVNAQRATVPAAVETLYLSGYLAPDGEVHLSPIYRQAAPVTASAKGSFRMELLGEGGRVLAAYPFETTASADVEGFSSFGFFVPAVDGLQGLRLWRSDQVMAERVVEQPVPGLSMTGRKLEAQVEGDKVQLEWGGARQATPGVLYRLRLSTDGGRSWQVLALSLSEPSFSAPVGTWFTGTPPMLEIQATDGIHTSTESYPVHSTFGD